MPALPRLTVAVLALALSSPLAAAPRWTALGPFGGDVQHLTLDPADPRVLYATLGDQGVFKSADQGASWTPILAGVAVGNVAVDPTRHTTIYQAVSPDQVLKSIDGGAHWTASGRIDGLGKAGALAVDPAVPSRIYLATAGGVWHSLDGGASWSPSRRPLPDSALGIRTLVALPRPAGTVFAATHGGLFKSVDGGDSWKLGGRGLPAGGVTALVQASRAGTLWAAVEQRGIFFSPNGGVSWKAAATQPKGAAAVTALAVSPGGAGDPGSVWVSTAVKGVFRTADAGAHWSPTGLRAGASVTSLALGGSTLYAGLLTSLSDVSGRDAGGVFASNDGGITWQPRNRGLAGLIVDLAIDPRDPQAFWATAVQGIFRSSVGGVDWNFSPRPPSQITADPVSRAIFSPVFSADGSAFYVVSSHLLWKTVDDGASWSEAGPPNPPHFITNEVVTDPQDPGTLYVPQSQADLYTSHDAGATWHGQTLPLPCGLVALAVAPSAPGTIYAGGASDRAGSPSCSQQRAALYRSTDGGATWAAADAGLDAEPASLFVRSVAVDPVDPRTLYAGLYQSEAVWKSTDGGATWTRIDTGLNLQFVPVLTVSPLDGSVWATDGFQVVFSHDAGATWTSAGAPQSNLLFDVVPDPRNANRLYVTGWGGVWLLELEPGT